ncbi:MAG: nuclear transport factor 2 family protein [Hyphomicrobiales bacterium]
MKSILLALSVAVGALGVSTAWAADLPPLVPQSSPQQVVDEHLDALNKCDWNRLMAQYPPEVLIIIADGASFRGREAVGELFKGFCKSKADGGLNGLQFTTLSTFTVEGTLNVIWEADADFLAEPYKGADAYVTKDGFMYAQVTTFDGSKLKFK